MSACAARSSVWIASANPPRPRLLFKEFGFTSENVVAKVKGIL
jgi:hypothetical protein